MTKVKPFRPQSAPPSSIAGKRNRQNAVSSSIEKEIERDGLLLKQYYKGGASTEDVRKKTYLKWLPDLSERELRLLGFAHKNHDLTASDKKFIQQAEEEYVSRKMTFEERKENLRENRRLLTNAERELEKKQEQREMETLALVTKKKEEIEHAAQAREEWKLDQEYVVQQQIKNLNAKTVEYMQKMNFLHKERDAQIEEKKQGWRQQAILESKQRAAHETEKKKNTRAWLKDLKVRFKEITTWREQLTSEFQAVGRFAENYDVQRESIFRESQEGLKEGLKNLKRRNKDLILARELKDMELEARLRERREAWQADYNSWMERKKRSAEQRKEQERKWKEERKKYKVDLNVKVQARRSKYRHMFGRD
ncbi:hypothetical protein CYMTET_26663 [Cymbomonas tetramitiformis]|uniref:Uncharacterized protein n=1 Tax=Cymbomonas tetramitiformis TaxID=36881 RepID=A0AAE0FRB3_9CHLO|nr:hypothetical protein CYMTET_26663 [Cymbomonas tetramitiformis]